MKEKTLKKMVHYLTTNADYDNIEEIKAYIEKIERKQGITLEEWEYIYELFCRIGEIPIQRWVLEEKVNVIQEDDDAIRYVMLVTGKFAHRLEQAKIMEENMALLCEFATEEQKKEFISLAFVIACGYTNIYLVKYLLEQGADVNYRFQDMTGMEIALKYAECMEGYGDDTVYQYLLRNQNCQGELEDVLKYYVVKKDFLDNEYYKYETEAVRQKELDSHKLDSRLCRHKAESMAAEYGYPDLFDENTSNHVLADIMEEYYWDNGMELPYHVAMHPNCDLAVALKIYYDGEGYLKYLDKEFYESYKHEEWTFLIETLEQRIVEDCYKKENLYYRIPMNDEQKKRLKENGAPEILWTNVE